MNLQEWISPDNSGCKIQNYISSLLGPPIITDVVLAYQPSNLVTKFRYVKICRICDFILVFLSNESLSDIHGFFDTMPTKTTTHLYTKYNLQNHMQWVQSRVWTRWFATFFSPSFQFWISQPTAPCCMLQCSNKIPNSIHYQTNGMAQFIQILTFVDLSFHVCWWNCFIFTSMVTIIIEIDKNIKFSIFCTRLAEDVTYHLIKWHQWSYPASLLAL